MPDRYPGYDVLKKRHSVSWNAPTRAVIDERLLIDPGRHRFFSDLEWLTIRAVCDRIIPQTAVASRRVPLAAMVDEKLCTNKSDGYRYAELPPMRKAWQLGLKALDAEANARSGMHFHHLPVFQQNEVLATVQRGEVKDKSAWGDLPPQSFFTKRLLHDIVSAYYAHPISWSEIGFGGPASPRGYVRMNFDRRDPWEAAEARPGREAIARKENERVG